MLKITAISDNHGNLNPYLPRADLLIIGGDLEPDGSPLGQAEWLDRPFRKWLNKIKSNFKHIIMYGGNHSFALECLHFKYGDWKDIKKIIDTLPLELVTLGQTSYAGYEIAITSFCMKIGNWSFPWEEDDYARWLEKINKCDIMLCHGPPWAMLDEAYRYLPDGSIGFEHTGSKELASWVMKVRPRLLVCNHIHEAYGTFDIKHYDNSITTIANVSQVDRGNNFKDRPVEIYLP